MVFIGLVLTGMQIVYLLFSAYTWKGGALSFGHLIPAGIVIATWFVIWVSLRAAGTRSKPLFALLLAPSIGISLISSALLIITFIEGAIESTRALISSFPR